LAKNILVFADGTGNEGGLLPDESRTNVYKLYRATRTGPDSIIDPKKQLALYVPGIGTPTPGHDSGRDRQKQSLQQMFGFGISEKIIDCYVALVGVWEPKDRIYLFGFSRGAYTARCLAHVLELCGIPTKERNGDSISLDPKSLRKVAKDAVSCVYQIGMPRNETDAAKRAEEFRTAHASEAGRAAGASAYFIGIWDAVAAIGWQRFFPDWAYDRHFTSDVQYARHLQSIDEGRKDFKRVPWGGSGTVKWPDRKDEPEQFDQIWFAGNARSKPGHRRQGFAATVSIGRRDDARRMQVGIGGTALHWSKAVRDVPDGAQLLGLRASATRRQRWTRSSSTIPNRPSVGSEAAALSGWQPGRRAG
jgi:uncharacterized protein (DUF2235 family)